MLPDLCPRCKEEKEQDKEEKHELGATTIGEKLRKRSRDRFGAFWGDVCKEEGEEGEAEKKKPAPADKADVWATPKRTEAPGAEKTLDIHAEKLPERDQRAAGEGPPPEKTIDMPAGALEAGKPPESPQPDAWASGKDASKKPALARFSSYWGDTQLTEEKATEEPAEETPTEEKAPEEKVAEEKPPEEEPSEERVAGEKPPEEEPSEERVAGEKPPEEEPSVAQLPAEEFAETKAFPEDVFGELDEASSKVTEETKRRYPELWGEVPVEKQTEKASRVADEVFFESERLDPLVGKEIGGCQVEKPLGRGGMGAVYLARHLGLQRTVALKILPPALSSRKRLVLQFFREARALAKSEHPNIVSVYDVGEEGEYFYISMQYIDGGNLADLLEKRGGRIPADEATRIIQDAARGLQHAHDVNVIHRDVKPENIMLTSAGEVKVGDFGIARETESGGFTFGTGQIIGTPFYMSPEQIDGRDIDARSDIYSLGGTYYHILTGSTPFQGDSAVDIILKHLNEPLESPKKHDRSIPDSVCTVISMMMAKNKEMRYTSMKEVINDLDAVLKGEEVKKELITKRVVKPIPEPVPEVEEPVVEIEKPVGFYIGVAALILLIIAGAVVGAVPARELYREYFVPDGSEAMGPADIAAERAFRSALTLAEEKPNAHEEIIGALEAVLKEYPEYSDKEDVEHALEEWRGRFKGAGLKKFKEVTERIAFHEKKGQYGKALLYCTDFPGRFKPFGFQQKLDQERRRLEKELNAKIGMTFVAPGPFLMGEAGKAVDLPGFYMDLREVSNRDYAEYLTARKRKPPRYWKDGRCPEGEDDLPVTGITYEEALSYAIWKGKRLPTEEEWEKAARGTDGRAWPWGNRFRADLLNSAEGGKGKLVPVDSLSQGASPYGCLNMAGNAFEWTSSNPPDSKTLRIIRGGGYASSRSNTRVFVPYAQDPREAHSAVGFRCAKSLDE
jgi:formylglycine-generating enzyme required for sulfatase activity